MLNIFTCFHVINSVQFSWVAQSCLIIQPHGLKHTMLPCPLPTLGACSNSCPSSQWCHPTISSSVIPLLLSSVFPSIGVFSNELVLCISRPKYWSFSFSVSHSNEYSGLIFFSFLFLFYFIFKLYNIVLALPNIELNLPQVHPCPPSWTPLPPSHILPCFL